MRSAATEPAPAMWPLYLTIVAIGMGQTVVFAVLPMLGRALELDQIVVHLPLLDIDWQPREMAITSLSALTALTYFFVSPIWGRRSDAIGRKPVIIIGLVGYGIGVLAFNSVAWLGLGGVLGGTMLYVWLVATRILHASLMSAAQPAASAYMVDVTTVATRTRGIGRLAAANQIGAMIGPVLAWFVFISLLAPMYLQAGLCLLVAVIVARVLKHRPPLPRPAHSARLRFFDARIRLFLLVGLALFTMMGMVQQTLGFYFQDVLQVPAARAAQLFSLAMVLSSLAMLIAQFGVVQRISERPIRLLFWGLPFCLSGYIVLSVAENLFGLMAGMALFGFGMGMAGPGFNSSATLAVQPHEQGGLAGLLGAAASMGFVLGPLVGGFLYRFDPAQPYQLASAGLAVLWVTVLLMRRRLV